MWIMLRSKRKIIVFSTKILPDKIVLSIISYELLFLFSMKIVGGGGWVSPPRAHPWATS